MKQIILRLLIAGLAIFITMLLYYSTWDAFVIAGTSALVGAACVMLIEMAVITFWRAPRP